MRLGIALHCQIPQWPLLPLLPTSPLPPPSSLYHPPPLSSVSLYSLRRAPCDGCVLTGLSHSDATRGKLMCPRLRRGITPCDGTSASALSRIRRSAGCGKKIRKRTETPQRIPEQLLLRCWWVVMSLWHNTEDTTKVLIVCRCSHFLSAAVNPGCHISAAGDTRGTWQSPNPKHESAWTVQPGQIQRQFSCWINDSSSIKTLLSEEDEGLSLWGLSACGQQEDMIIEWLHLHFWTHNVKRGDMEQGREAAE